MEITQTQKDNIVVLELKGRLDTNTSNALEKKILDLIDQKKDKLVVDFAQIDFISSSGLRVLLMGAKKLKNINGKIVLSSLKDHVKDVFDIAGFTMLFSMFPSQEEAIQSLQ